LVGYLFEAPDYLHNSKRLYPCGSVEMTIIYKSMFPIAKENILILKEKAKANFAIQI